MTRLPDVLHERLKAEAEANDRSMNAEIVRLIERGLASAPGPLAAEAVTSPSPQLPTPAFPRQGELFPLPEIDTMERLVGIVERTNRIFGVAAARRLWPMLGLPDLRTSDGQEDDGEASLPARAGGKPAAPRSAPNGVREAEGRGETPPPSAPEQGGREMPPPVKVWVARFLDECCEIDPLAETRAVAFREAYTLWAHAQGAPIPMPSGLGRYVHNLGIRRRKSGGNIYVGIRLHAVPPSDAAGSAV